MCKLHSLMFSLFAFALFGLGVIGFSEGNYASDPVETISQAYDSQKCAVYSTDGSLPGMVLTTYVKTGHMNPGIFTATDYIPTFENIRSGADCLKKSFAINDMKVSNPHSARDSLSFQGISS